MLFAFINDNKIIKIEDSDEELVDSVRHHYQQVMPIDGIDPVPQVGWVYDNGSVYRYLAPLSPRQIRQALLLNGIDLTMIDASLSSLSEPMRSFAIVSWEYAVEYDRRDPMTDQVAFMLGWTSEQTDALWALGASL